MYNHIKPIRCGSGGSITEEMKMDKNENLTETKKVRVDAGLKLFMFLSKADTQLISLIIMLMLSAQVLFGVFEKTEYLI